ncbi:MAG: hypothetical protein ACK53Y_06490 [bacterium]
MNGDSSYGLYRQLLQFQEEDQVAFKRPAAITKATSNSTHTISRKCQ